MQEVEGMRYSLTTCPGAPVTDLSETLAFDQTRLDKVRALREKGIDLYPATFERKDTIADIRTKFADITHDKSEESVATAGRLYIIRNHGKTIFADLGDESGRSSSTCAKRISGTRRSISSTSTSSGATLSA